MKSNIQTLSGQALKNYIAFNLDDYSPINGSNVTIL